jgi:iron complex outermembrane receptor protein
MGLKLKFGLMAGASLLGFAILGAPATAQEQTAPAEAPAAPEGAVPERIVVTGFREALAEALDVKREASGVVDAIVAEDIAAFPDLNLAESLQRIPGLSIDRVGGEGRQITVRGLGADFTRIRINGMEALSTSGASDSSGGSNRGRGFDFNTFASDLFNKITVTKTSSAAVEEGSLGATVDLRTARPFDYDSGLNAAASAQGGYNELSEEFNPRYAGLMSWSNEDQTIGALLSLAYSDRAILEEGFSTVRWADANFRSVNGATCPAGPSCSAVDVNSNIYHPRIPRYGRLTHEQERLGVTGSLQFAPTSQTTISLDGLYSKLDATREEAYLEVFFRSQENRIDVVNFTTNSGASIMDSGVFNISPLANGTHPIRSENRFDVLTTEFTQFTAEVDHEFTDTLRANLVAGTVKSEHANPVQTTMFFDAVGTVTGYTYDFRGNMETPFIDYGSLDVTDPTEFAFTEIRDRPQFVDNAFDTVAGRLEYDINDSLTVSGGGSWKKFEFETAEYRRESTSGSLVCALPGITCPAGAVGLPITPDLASYVSGFGKGLDLPGGVDTRWLTPNVAALADRVNLYDIVGAPQAGNMRSVEEEDLGGFVQLGFNVDLGPVPVRGDVGVRYVETTTTSTGNVSGTVVTVERSYEDTLPSLNLTFEVTPDFYVRAGAAKVMARPSLGNLTPGGSLDSFNGPPFRYNSGNPSLDPFRATTYDLSFEWYFQDEGLIALSLFNKDVDSFFTRAGVTEVPYSQSGLPTTLPPPSSPLRNQLDAGLDPMVELRAVENGGSASVQGFEIAYQQPFTFLPIQGFGLQANYTYVESDEIIGFSPNAYNATLYYENERFSARVSAAYRDAYVTQNAVASGRDEWGYGSTTNIDFASSFALTDQIDITFEAINLTDEFEHQVFDTADLVSVYHHTGTEYLIGARYKY